LIEPAVTFFRRSFERGEQQCVYALMFSFKHVELLTSSSASGIARVIRAWWRDASCVAATREQ
jgi:hypothetical protein